MLQTATLLFVRCCFQWLRGISSCVYIITSRCQGNHWCWDCSGAARVCVNCFLMVVFVIIIHGNSVGQHGLDVWVHLCGCLFVLSITQKRMIPKCSNLVLGMNLGYSTSDMVLFWGWKVRVRVGVGSNCECLQVYNKFTDMHSIFGIFRFRVMLRTNKQMDSNILPMPTNSSYLVYST